MQRRRSAKKLLTLENLEHRRVLASYSVVDLGFLEATSGAFENGWSDNEWNDINNKGQVAGRIGDSAVLWNPSPTGGGTGSMVELGKLDGYDLAVGQSVSSNGLVAGFSVAWTTSEGVHSNEPFLWVPDEPNGDTGSMLATSVSHARAKGVNSSGKLVGEMNLDEGIPNALIWERDSAGDPHVTNLNDAVPREQLTEQGIEDEVVLFEATAINDNNQVIVNGWYGEDTNGDGNFDIQKVYAFLLEDNDDKFWNGEMTITHLGSLGGHPHTAATDINKHGQITGESDSPQRDHGRHAFLWQDGTMTDLGTLGRDTESRPTAISDNGMVVGQSTDRPFVTAYDAFLWQDGHMIELGKELPRNSDWTLRWAWGVNDDAQVVGMGEAPYTSEHKDWRGYLLTTDAITLPQISINDATVTEGDLDALGNPELTTVELEVSLSEPAAEAITVDYYTAGDWDVSVADDDFVSKSDSVTFQPGEMSKTITVQVIGDLMAGAATHDQGDEFFFVNLVNPHNESGEQAGVFHDAQGSVTILEDEPSMSIGDVELPEGDLGHTTYTFTVSLSSPAKTDISVNWQTKDNTAKADEDYEAGSGTLVILAGKSSGEIPIQVIGDPDSESTEVFRVILDEDTVNNAFVANAYGTGYIENDDGGGKKGGGRGKPGSTTVATTETLLVNQIEPLTYEQTTVQTQGKGNGNGGGGGNGGGEDPPAEPPAVAFTDGKDVFVTDADGADAERVVRSGNQKEGVSYSPDGSQIAFQVGETRSLHVTDVTTTSTTASIGLDVSVYASSGVDRGPSWSPDGQWIAFSAASGSHYDLFRVRSDGFDLTQLTNTSRKDELFPIWNPNWAQTTAPLGVANELTVAAMDAFYAADLEDAEETEVGDDLLLLMARDRLF